MGISWVFQRSSKGASGKLQRCLKEVFRGVPGVFQGSFMGVPTVFNDVLRNFQRSSKQVSRKFQRCFIEVLSLFSE